MKWVKCPWKSWNFTNYKMCLCIKLGLYNVSFINWLKLMYLLHGAAVPQWSRRRTCTQWTWVQLPLVPVWVLVAAGRTSRQNCSHVVVKSCLDEHVWTFEQGSQRCWIRTVVAVWCNWHEPVLIVQQVFQRQRFTEHGCTIIGYFVNFCFS